MPSTLKVSDKAGPRGRGPYQKSWPAKCTSPNMDVYGSLFNTSYYAPEYFHRILTQSAPPNFGWSTPASGPHQLYFRISKTSTQLRSSFVLWPTKRSRTLASTKDYTYLSMTPAPWSSSTFIAPGPSSSALTSSPTSTDPSPNLDLALQRWPRRLLLLTRALTWT
jgi:hypothetical protein